MKNTLKTTLLTFAGLSIMTVSAQISPTQQGNQSNIKGSNVNSVSDGKTINAAGTTKSANTNLKGQNDVSATQSSSAKPGANSTNINSSKVTTSTTGSTSAQEKKGVETRGVKRAR